MKTFFAWLAFLFLQIPAPAQQFYYRGEVKDEAGNPLQNVTIIQKKTDLVYHTGHTGTFGIVANVDRDSLDFFLEGYERSSQPINADTYLVLILKRNSATSISRNKYTLLSLTRDLARAEQDAWLVGDETYASLLENHFIEANKFPNTQISLSIDCASYSNIRRFLNYGEMVPPDAVRIEEMMNYFNLNYQLPQGNSTFAANTAISTCPWNPANQLYYVNISSRKLNFDTLPPCNLVFLIDVSGSMDMPNRLPLLKSAFRLLVNNLRAKDSVAIVTYGGVTGVMLNTVGGDQKDTIIRTIEDLEPSGSTPGESGIKLAYSVAKNHFVKGGYNRVILATDGDFNVGVKSEDELNELISQQKLSGVYLTCLGVGMGNYKDSKIQTLAINGNGNFAYIDNYAEAQKVLVKELTQTLFSVADNTFMNVEFNPEYVKDYRLIGFDNKAGAIKDTSSAIEGGEIGSGHSQVAIFEITPTQESLDIIKSGKPGGKFATIQIRYHDPGSIKDKYFSSSDHLVLTPQQELSQSFRFATAIALFGSMLRNSPFVKNSTWEDVLQMAENACEQNNAEQKEFINLVQQAKKIYPSKKKKKIPGIVKQ